MPSRRQERIANRITQEVAVNLRVLNDPRLGFLTVVGCDVSPDLRHAKVRVSVLGDDAAADRALDILRSMAGRLRKSLSQSLEIKVTPQLSFEIDRTAETADRMSQLIVDARQSDPNPNPYSEEEQAAFLASMAPANLGPRAGSETEEEEEAGSWRFVDMDEDDDEEDESDEDDDQDDEEEGDGEEEDEDWRPVNPD